MLALRVERDGIGWARQPVRSPDRLVETIEQLSAAFSPEALADIVWTCEHYTPRSRSSTGDT